MTAHDLEITIRTLRSLKALYPDDEMQLIRAITVATAERQGLIETPGASPPDINIMAADDVGSSGTLC